MQEKQLHQGLPYLDATCRIFGAIPRWRLDQRLLTETGWYLSEYDSGRIVGIGTYREMVALLDTVPRLQAKDRQLTLPEIMVMPQAKSKLGKVKGMAWGPPLEREKAETWEPRKGETRIVTLLSQGDGKFGRWYLVTDHKTGDEFFLPNHSGLSGRLESVTLKSGAVMQIHCLKVGNRKAKTPYVYEVRLSKRNAPF